MLPCPSVVVRPRYDTKLWMRDLMEGAAYRPPGRQGAPWPRFDRHDGEVPAHAAGRGRLHAGRVYQDPRAGGGQQAARSPYLAKGGGLVRVGGEYVGVGDRGDAVDQVETADDHQHDRREQDQTVAAAFRVPPASASGWFGCWTPIPLPRSHRAQPEAASCQWGETGAASLRRSTGPMSCKWSMPAGVRRWRSPAASQATGAALSPAATFPPGYSLLDDGPGIATARPEGRDLWPWRWDRWP